MLTKMDANNVDMVRKSFEMPENITIKRKLYNIAIPITSILLKL